MTFQTVADFEALTGDEALTPAEIKLIADCRAGERCWLEDGKRPDTDTSVRRIRASLLRVLIVGGRDECDLSERGVDLYGGWIDGELNLDFATGRGFTDLMHCHFTHEPQMNSVKLGSLNLTGSKLPGLYAQGAKIKRSVFLRNGFHTTGTINLNSAEIGGQLDCTKGRFDGDGEEALNGQGVKVTQDVFLRGGFHSTGTVNLNGAKIGGQLDCNEGRLDGDGEEALKGQGVKVTQSAYLHNGFHATGTVDLNMAEVGGQLVCAEGRFDGNGGNALMGQKIRIDGVLFWKNVQIDTGMVDLEGAKVGDLYDDLASWPDDPKMLSINGFTYDRIASFTDTKKRLIWLERGAQWPSLFYPQPYVQLAKVLRAQGHIREARQVAYEAEKIGRKHENRQLRIIPNGDVLVGLNSVWRDLKRAWLCGRSWVLRLTVGYGLFPIWSVYWLVLLIALTTFPAHYAWEEGSMVPNSGPVLVSAGWLQIADAKHTAETWSLTDPGRDWETFNRYAWAADLVIPIVDLGQTAAWAPSTERGPWGEGLWWARWFLISLGWIVSALGAAAITGIVRRE